MKTTFHPGTAGRPIIAFLALLAGGCTNTLNRAIYREKPETVTKFLDAGYDVNHVDGDGGTPLIYAAQYGDLPLIEKLVDRGAKINALDHRGNSALGYLVAGETCKHDAVVYLLARGADLTVVNREGRGVFHRAASRPCKPADGRRQAELLRTLVDAGADPNATADGDLALHLAAAAGQPDEALDYLLHVTRDPQLLNGRGYTAFSEAARTDQLAAARFLAGRGFEPQSLPAPVGLPTAHALIARGHDAFGDYLLAKGDPAAALASYQTSAASYHEAVETWQGVISHYEADLKAAKAARKGKWISTVALNVVGGGMAAATGVGFIAVPKRSENPIDDYEAELARDRPELAALQREQTAMLAKIQELQARLPPAAPRSEASPENGNH